MIVADEAAQCEQLVERMTAELRELCARAEQCGTEDELEQAVLGWRERAGRRVMQALAQALVERREREQIQICCQHRMDHHSRRTRTVVTLLGTATVRRRYWRCLHCGRSVFPADAWLGWKHGFSHRAEEAVAWLCSQLPYREAAGTLRKLTGLEVSVLGAERIVRRWGEPALALPPSAERVRKDFVVQIDGVITHLQEGWKETKVGAFFAWDCEHPDQDPSDVSYVADWRNAEEFRELIDEESVVRGAAGARAIALLGDGALWIWELAAWLFPRAVQILDWYHLSQHLWQAAAAVHGKGTEPTARLAKRWEGEVWEGRSEGVEEHLRELVNRGQDDSRRTLKNCADYLQTHQHRIRYPLFRAMGWPVGSGVVEGACNHVVGLRFKRKSTRWSKPGGRAVLRLRLDRLNGRWEQRCELVRGAA